MPEQSQNKPDRALPTQAEQTLDERENLVQNRDFSTFLAATQPRANDSFQQDLEARLLARLSEQSCNKKEKSRKMQPSTTSPKSGILARLFPTPTRRAFASILLAVALVAGVILVVPPARTWAQQALDSTLSALGFMRLDASKAVDIKISSANDFTVVPAGTLASSLENVGSKPLSAEQAAAQAGFSPKVPAYLPAGYTAKGFMSGAVTLISENGSTSGLPGSATWEAAKTAQSCNTLELQQKAKSSRLGNFSVGSVLINEQSSPVEVNGQPGVYVTGRKGGCGEQHILAWEQDGRIYHLIADVSLSKDELYKIAASLK